MSQPKIYVSLDPDTTRGPSGSLWGNCDFRHAPGSYDPSEGYGLFDDFVKPINLTDDYQSVGDASPAWAQLVDADTPGGVVRAAITNTDNNEAYLASHLDLAGFAGLDNTANSGRKTWFECRFRSSYVSDWGLIVGLGEAAICAANLIVDNQTALATAEGFIGFRILTADPDGLDAVYIPDAGAETVVQEAAGTIAVNTWTKVGIYHDPEDGTFFYVNGVKHSSTGLTPLTTTPYGEALGFIIGAKTGTSEAINLDLDWFEFAQSYE